MGNSPSHPVYTALNELLRSKNLKLKQSTPAQFLSDVDIAAPWFAMMSGALTVPSWDKLGHDLDFAFEQVTLKGGVRPIWKLVKGCLTDQRCSSALDTSKVALNILEGEKSEANSVIQTSARKGYTSEEEEEDDKDKILDEKFKFQSMYPSLCERHHKLKDRENSFPLLLPVTPTAPPPYENVNPEEITMPPPNNSLHHSIWRQVCAELISSGTGPKILMSFPVFLDQAGNQFHEPLDFKTVKKIADSVRTYGVVAAFTLRQVESLTRHAMTPWDWSNLVRACMAPEQFLEWKAYFTEYASAQAMLNRTRPPPQNARGVDMLTGTGLYANNQVALPPLVFDQINALAIKAWKSVPTKGEVRGNLTKIIQKAEESFSDFVTRMVEAAGRLFDEPDAMMPMLKLLIFEQATKECRDAITPHKTKGLESWVRVCREVGGLLSNSC
uniref:igE-binding protein-like n=1 Tax=Myodes glareolus TaxID=447135 RepID=UPI0020211275|nr:igE-binding protein-like [Myodes glareolus]